MEKAYREMLDVIRAEVAELYRLRCMDAKRICQLERLARCGTVAQNRDTRIAEPLRGSGDPDVTLI